MKPAQDPETVGSSRNEPPDAGGTEQAATLQRLLEARSGARSGTGRSRMARLRRRSWISRWTAPKTTRSMRSAIESLEQERLNVVHAGEESFQLAEGIDALAFGRLREEQEPL